MTVLVVSPIWFDSCISCSQLTFNSSIIVFNWELHKSKLHLELGTIHFLWGEGSGVGGSPQRISYMSFYHEIRQHGRKGPRKFKIKGNIVNECFLDCIFLDSFFQLTVIAISSYSLNWNYKEYMKNKYLRLSRHLQPWSTDVIWL